MKNKASLIIIAVSSAILLGGCSQTPVISDSTSLPEVQEEPNPIECLLVENIGNIIDENVESFDGDPSPTDLWVYPRFRYSNNCEQNVVGMKGSISFQDVVGDEIFNGGWTEDITIPMGKSVKSDPNSGYEFNQFQDQHGVLTGTDENKTTAVFMIETLVFEDGTKISR
jgi:PBP1b-binding outer membrane lipoprotein LpoB